MNVFSKMILISLSILVVLNRASANGFPPQANSQCVERRMTQFADYDGRFVLTAAGIPGVATLWDAGSGQMIKKFLGHLSSISAVAICADESTIATGGAGAPPWVSDQDFSIRLWNIRTGQCIVCNSGDSKPDRQAINALEFSRDGRLLLSSAEDGAIRIWSTRNGHQLVALNTKPLRVFNVHFSPDGAQVAAIVDDEAEVWNAKTGDKILRIPSARWIAFVDTRKVVLDYGRGIAQVWDLGTQKKVLEFSDSGVRLFVDSMAAAGKVLAGVLGDSTVRTWSTSSGKMLQTITLPAQSDRICVSRDGAYCLARTRAGVVLLSLIEGRQVVSLSAAQSRGLVGFSRDGKSFCIMGGSESPSMICSSATGQVLKVEHFTGQSFIGG